MPLSAAFSLPAGCISQYAASAAPEGWLLMYGQTISRTTYAALFLAIGTTDGAGDGSTTFNLPDMRGRLPVGKDDMGGSAANRVTSGGSGITGTTLGAVGGAETVTLSAAQMPSHNHTLQNQVYTSSVASTSALSEGQDGMLFVNTDSKGSSGAHSNLPPALIINYIIKT